MAISIKRSVHLLFGPAVSVLGIFSKYILHDAHVVTSRVTVK